MQTVTIEEARADFDKLVEQVQKSGLPTTITGPNGALVQIVPVVKPAYFYKGRPVYTTEQMKNMDFPYPSEEQWLKDIESEAK